MTETPSLPGDAPLQEDPAAAPGRPLTVTAVCMYGSAVGAVQIMAACVWAANAIASAASRGIEGPRDLLLPVSAPLVPFILGILSIAGSALALRRRDGGRPLMVASFGGGAVLTLVTMWVPMFLMFRPPVYIALCVAAIILLFTAQSKAWFSKK